MELANLITLAQQEGASDLHLEPGLPAAIRVRGSLRTMGEPLSADDLLRMARGIVDESEWPEFLKRRSCDFSKTVQGVRCRFNVLHTSRGVGFAIRLLTSFQATIERLNLHPDLKKLATPTNGLIIVSGPTGSGKSSTLAAILQEINLTQSRHIVTVESPIEYFFKPRRAYIRQREVGRDTPSFEQALLDSLRQDPDVLMVGEMRDPETMRLTLGASETGHLVLATMHSSSCAEALQRIVSAFPAESQPGVASQLSDCLVAVVTQRLRFKPELNIRVPECEILMATHAVKNFIRNRDFFKIASSLETGADSGMWSFQRYRAWLESRKSWSIPGKETEPPDEPGETRPQEPAVTPPAAKSSAGAEPFVPKPASASPRTHRIVIEPSDSGFGKILRPPKP